MKWIKKKTEIAYKNPYLTIHKDCVLTSGGIQIDDFYSVTLADSVMIVAITTEREIILKKEYRYSCKKYSIECPAGSIERGENKPLMAAKRELLEETGYTSKKWSYLGETNESTSKLTNKMHIFLAEDCIRVSEQKLDKTEDIEVMVVKIEDAIDMVMKNEILYNTSSYGILKIARLLGV